MPDLLSLLSWSTQPHIAAWLAYYHTVQDHHSRRLAITKLESLLKTSDSQVEQRRAASTLLRALDHQWPRERPGSAARRSPSPLSPRLDGERCPRLGEDGEGCPSSPRQPPSPEALAAAQARANRSAETLRRLTDQLSKTLGIDPASPPSPLDTSNTASLPIQNPQSKIQNPPSITPNLSHSPTTLARAIAQSLQLAQDIGPAAVTVRALATPDFLATYDSESLLDLIEPHLGLPPDAHISEPEHSKPFDHEDGCRIEVTHPSRPFTLRLEFLKKPSAPWLLDLFDTG